MGFLPFPRHNQPTRTQKMHLGDPSSWVSSAPLPLLLGENGGDVGVLHYSIQSGWHNNTGWILFLPRPRPPLPHPDRDPLCSSISTVAPVILPMHVNRPHRPVEGFLLAGWLACFSYLASNQVYHFSTLISISLPVYGHNSDRAHRKEKAYPKFSAALLLSPN
jgi:hypothetical protein